MKQKISKTTHKVWCGMKKNIDSLLTTLLHASIVALLFVIAFHLFFFTNDKYLHLFDFDNAPATQQNGFNANEIAQNTKSGIAPSAINQADNEALLALLSILIAFAGLLAYIFYHLVKDNIQKELKIMANDERLASKAEMQIATSNIFSKLYELTEKMEKEEEKFIQGDLQYTACRVYNVFKANGFLDSAILHDKLAVQLIKKITNVDDFNDMILKVLNNRGYNIYLKYKRLEKLKNENSEIKDIKLKVSDEEIQTALEIKNKLLQLIVKEDYYLYKDINSYHIQAWKDTCEKINELVKISPEWKRIQEDMYNQKN